MRTRTPLALAVIGSLLTSFAAIVATTAPAHADTVVPTTFGYTGGEQVYTIPPNVTAVHVTAIGARGGTGGASGDSGTQGSAVDADVPVPAGVTKFYVNVGQAGGDASTAGVFNGGSGGGAGAGPFGGAGGGGSDVRTCPESAPCDTQSSRLVVAAGGGGGGGRCIAIGCIASASGTDASATSGGNGGVSPIGGPGFAGGFFAGGIGGFVINPGGGGGGGGGGGWYGGGGGAGGSGLGAPFVANSGGHGGRGSDHVVASASNVTSTLTDAAASVTISYTVRTTSITYTGPTGGELNTPTTVSAKLSSALGPIAGASLSFSIDGGGQCVGTTNVAGVASCSLTPTGPAGAHTITVGYGGLANAYLPTSTAAPFSELKRPTKVVYNGATTSPFHHPATVSGTLTNSTDNQAVPGASLTFTLNGSETCTGTTDASGKASCEITPNEPQGTYTLATTYDGDASHLSSSTTSAFKVTLEPTVLTFLGAPRVANDEPATLSAKLVEDIGPAVVGRAVTLKLGSGLTAQSCTGTTDSFGVASCQIASVHQPLNATATLPVAVSFAGDNFYLKSTASGTVGLQYMTGQSYAVAASVLLPHLSLTIKPTPNTGAVRQAVPFTKSPPCVLTITGKIGLKSLCAKVVIGTAPGRTTATSSIASITIGLPDLPVITVGAISASAVTSCSGSVGDTTIAGLTVGGQAVDVSLHPGANSVVAIPGTAAKLILNKQVVDPTADHGLTVTAVELVIPASPGVYVHVDLATANSGIHNCTT